MEHTLRCHEIKIHENRVRAKAWIISLPHNEYCIQIYSAATKRQGVPFILLLNIWWEHYIWMLFGDKWNDSYFIRCDLSCTKVDAAAKSSQLLSHSRTQIKHSSRHFFLYFIAQSPVSMQRTWPMSSGWLRNSTDPDEFLGLLISSRKMPLLSFFLSFSFESLMVNDFVFWTFNLFNRSTRTEN